MTEALRSGADARPVSDIIGQGPLPIDVTDAVTSYDASIARRLQLVVRR